MSLHNDIMNIVPSDRCEKKPLLYRLGLLDAKNQAANLSLPYDRFMENLYNKLKAIESISCDPVFQDFVITTLLEIEGAALMSRFSRKGAHTNHGSSEGKINE